MLKTPGPPVKIFSEKRLAQNSDFSFINEIANKVPEENNEVLKKYLAGKKKLFDFFTGEIMKKTGGKTNPEIAAGNLQEKLDGQQS